MHDNKITNITLLNSNKCKNCQNENIITIKLPYITFNEDDIEKEKGDIKKLFTNFNSNEINKKEYCQECKNITDQVISPINVKYSKYIIILIEKGKNINNLDKLEIIEKDENENKIFKLISIIIEDKESYHYYNRELEHKQFTKNEKEINENNKTTVYNLDEIKGNIICLFYRLEESINNGKKSQPSTVAGSIYNGETQNKDVELNPQSNGMIIIKKVDNNVNNNSQNSNNNCNFLLNNFMNGNNNNNQNNNLNNNINNNNNNSNFNNNQSNRNQNCINHANNNRGFNNNSETFQNNNVHFQNNNNNNFQNINNNIQNNNINFQNYINNFQNININSQNNNNNFQKKNYNFLNNKNNFLNNNFQNNNDQFANNHH